MSEKNNGGPAFPGPDQQECRENIHEGMTLRDYFAAKVVQGMCARGDHSHRGDDIVAKDAYSIADAMLRARNV